MRWFLVMYRLPAERSSARVSVWREVRRSGALELQQSVIAFPDSEPFTRAVARIRAAVDEVGGSAVAMLAEPRDAADEARLRSAWNEARSEEYRELISECEKLVAEIDKEFEKQKFTLAELDEEDRPTPVPRPRLGSRPRSGLQARLAEKQRSARDDPHSCRS